MRDFEKLKVWERSHYLVLQIYQMTKSLPKDEQYGITSQIRRASLSIPTNIAEGCGKYTERDFAKFLNIAYGSASEVQYLLLLIKDLKYITEPIITELENEITEIKKMLYSLIEKLKNSDS